MSVAVIIMAGMSVPEGPSSAAQGEVGAEGPAGSGEGGVRVVSTSPAQEPTWSGVLLNPAWLEEDISGWQAEKDVRIATRLSRLSMGRD